MRNLFLFLASVCVCAAESSTDSSLSLNALRQQLNLTDGQVQQLLQIQADKSTAQQAIFDQIDAKQTALDALLAQSSPDVNKVGQLTIEISRLQAQVNLPDPNVKTRALAVLNAAQRTQLAPLSNALALALPAQQAASVDLLDITSQIVFSSSVTTKPVASLRLVK